MYEGESLGLVGESGCGKTSLSKAILGMQEHMSGEVSCHVSRPQMIFQDPYSSLNPRQTVSDIIMEPLRLDGSFSKEEIKNRTRELMDIVGIEKRLRMSYPHELDGGRRQRVGIARALALKPKFIVCDEPRVCTGCFHPWLQILNLLMDLQRDMGAYISVYHP